MHALIVVSHPHTQSLIHSVAARVAEGVVASDGEHTFEIADLMAEGFDPRFTKIDVDIANLRETTVPHDVATEQARIERADALVLVYPVYWWSMPGLLKGWIDRVFTNGWAYDDSPETGLVKKLAHLPVHLIAIGGADMRTYGRHGYFGAMKLQIDHGIFNYCGASVVTSELFVPATSDVATEHLEAAMVIGRRIFSDGG
jgi:NAD(P)H dehydrogenase (quinone)